MIFQLFSQPIEFIAFLIAIIIAVAFHEAAHALAATRLGDDTAKLSGRLTLNPFAHLDLVGSILFLLVGFGWGKPVPVNPNNFRNPNLDNWLVALAGPITNLIIAIIFGLPIKLLGESLQPWAAAFLSLVVLINLVLAVFNLIPIPPLDGSKVIALVFGERVLYQLEALSLPLLIIFLLMARSGFPLISFILIDIPDFLFKLVTGLSSPF